MTLLAAVLEHEYEDDEDAAPLYCVLTDGEIFDLFCYADPHVLMYTGLTRKAVGPALLRACPASNSHEVICLPSVPRGMPSKQHWPASPNPLQHMADIHNPFLT